MRRAAAVALLLLLAACGARQKLKPPVGASLPPKPATAVTQPTPEQLLALPVITRPSRSDELVTKSQPRPDDRFDLPPN
jgi:hypothetical protein